MRPEFLNRIDEMIMFTPLMKEEIAGIVSIQLEQLKQLLADNSIQLEYTEALVSHLAEEGFDPQYGARPLKRYIQKEIVNVLSKKILSGEIQTDKVLLLDVDTSGMIVFNNTKREPVH
jgi:ATP-dependent Clp protease ATP-binding subunit ClpB